MPDPPAESVEAAVERARDLGCADPALCRGCIASGRNPCRFCQSLEAIADAARHEASSEAAEPVWERVDRLLGAQNDLRISLLGGVAIHAQECPLHDECPWVLQARRVLADHDLFGPRAEIVDTHAAILPPEPAEGRRMQGKEAD